MNFEHMMRADFESGIVAYPKMALVKCGDCYGKGAVFKMACKKCKGYGYVEVPV